MCIRSIVLCIISEHDWVCTVFICTCVSTGEGVIVYMLEVCLFIRDYMTLCVNVCVCMCVYVLCVCVRVCACVCMCMLVCV